MIKNFKDIDGKRFNLQLRGRYTIIKSEKKLKEILDRSIEAQSPKMAECLKKHGYMYTMREWGMITQSQFLGQEKGA